MLKIIKNLLSDSRPPVKEADLISLTLAVCILLLEVARADDEFSPEEHDHILSTLRVRFSLSASEAEELMEIAVEKREESLDLWRFTNRVNEALGREDKLKVLEEVWRVIYADGTLDAHEDYLVHKLGRLLKLTHKELIEAKLKVLK
jgi:uncharacterized tellurite resistance protein B-like protein